MKILIVGAGYVGLVSGLVFASKGHEVICLEKDEEVIKKVTSGHSHIYEPGVDQLLQQLIGSNNFSIQSQHTISPDIDICFICVNTPVRESGMDLTQIEQALRIAGDAIRKSEKFISVVIKSTVLPGTTAGLAKDVLEKSSGKVVDKEFGIAVNPEFLREGNALKDFTDPDRIIVGTSSERTAQQLMELYNSWDCEKMVLNSSTAEFIKYYSNILLSLLISYSNEMANIARNNTDIDYTAVLASLRTYSRLSPLLPGYGRVIPEILSYMVPGPGFGGSCLPKDVEAFASFAGKSNMLEAIIKTNREQPQRIIDLLGSKIPNAFQLRYLVLGLSHKPDTDDIRESASLKIVDLLSDRNVDLILHDPVAMCKVKGIYEGKKTVNFTEDWVDALQEADVVVITTAWSEYKKLGNELKDRLGGKYLVDTRYVFKEVRFDNCSYISL